MRSSVYKGTGSCRDVDLITSVMFSEKTAGRQGLQISRGRWRLQRTWKQPCSDHDKQLDQALHVEIGAAG